MSRATWWLLGIGYLVVAAGVAVGGWRAGVTVGLPVYLVTLVAARTALADRPPPPPPVPEDPRPVTRTPAARVASTLSWATASGRHFDRATRPLLQRALRAALASRGLDTDRDRAQVRALLGETAWYLLDPARPPRDDSDTGGVDQPTVQQVVARLEELSG